MRSHWSQLKVDTWTIVLAASAPLIVAVAVVEVISLIVG